MMNVCFKRPDEFLLQFIKILSTTNGFRTTLVRNTFCLRALTNSRYFTGSENAYRRDVSCDPSRTFCGEYDPTVDPSSLNEFAQGAFRLFHSNAPTTVGFYDSSKLSRQT